MTLHPPHPPHRIPLLGDVIGLSVNKPAQTMTRMAERLGPIYELKVGPLPKMLVVNSGALATPVLDEKTWVKTNGPAFQRLHDIAPTGLLFAETDSSEWVRAHRILRPAFGREAMREYHETMQCVIADHIARWAGEVNIAACNALTFDVIARAAFGVRFTPTEIAQFVRHMRDFMTSSKIASEIPLIDGVVRKWRRDPHMRALQRLALAATEASHSPGPLLRALNDVDPETGTSLTPSQIADQAIIFLMAGHETASGTLAFALHELARQPDVVIEARNEITNAAATPNELSYEQIPQLRYTRSIIDETLRLYPVGPAFFRRPRIPTTVGPYPVTPDDWIYVNLMAIHRDPDQWGADANRFAPSRFAGNPVPPSYRPFGAGIRSCIGRGFAIHELTLALAHILATYDLSTTQRNLDITELPTLKPERLAVALAPTRAAAPRPG